MEKMNDEQLKRGIPFDLYGRYAMLRDIVNANRKEGQKFRVLDVGGRGNMMKDFLLEDDVFYLDPFIDSEDKNFIKGDGCAMPLENESFDWVVSADVFEHVPEEKRDDFLKENLRIAKRGVVLAAPFDSKEVKEAEANANENYKLLHSGEDHIWLKEHIANGLPSEKQIEAFVKVNKLEFSRFSNNHLLLWEMLLGTSFIALNNLDEDMKDDLQDFNYFYNTEVSPYDFSDPAYRKIFFIKKENGLDDPDILQKRIDDSLFLLTVKKAYDLLGKIDIRNKKTIRLKDEEIAAASEREAKNQEIVKNKEEILASKDKEIAKKDKELFAMRMSWRWRIPNYFYKLYRNIIKKA